MKKLVTEPDRACPGLGKISLFSLELNEKPNESGRFATVIMPFEYTDEKKFTVCLEGIFTWEENRNILLILS